MATYHLVWIIRGRKNGEYASIGSQDGPYGLNNTACQQAFYSIQANSTNTKYVGLNQTYLNQSEATALGLLYSSAQSNFTEAYTDGTFQLTETFNISGTLCTPIQGAKEGSALQLLVHGVAFDSSYWDFAVGLSDIYNRTGG